MKEKFLAKKIQRASTFILAALLSFWFVAPSAQAASTPVLSLTATSANTTQITVTGDAYSNVQILYYQDKATVPSAITNGASTPNGVSTVIGTTDSRGYFSLTVNNSSYGIPAASSVYTIVNGQQSAFQAWPSSYSGGYTNGLSLSQTAITLTSGQTLVISSPNGTGLSLYGNSNPPVASASISGNQISITGGSSYGSTVLTICSTNVGCNTITVTIQNISSSSLVLNQTNVSLVTGQTFNVYSSNGTGLSLNSNSNPAIASAYISGNQVVITANYVYGTATLIICSNNVGCNSITVLVQGSVQNTPSSNYGTNIFKQTSASVFIGQTIGIKTRDTFSNLYISSNSNSGIVSASASNDTLYIKGLAAGTATIIVCGNTSNTNINNCANLSVTVNGSTAFSQSSLNIALGQTQTVVLYGAGPFTVSNNTNSSAFSTSLSGNTLSVSASLSGSATITVCQNTSQQCNTLKISSKSNKIYRAK